MDTHQMRSHVVSCRWSVLENWLNPRDRSLNIQTRSCLLICNSRLIKIVDAVMTLTHLHSRMERGKRHVQFSSLFCTCLVAQYDITRIGNLDSIRLLDISRERRPAYLSVPFTENPRCVPRTAFLRGSKDRPYGFIALDVASYEKHLLQKG